MRRFTVISFLAFFAFLVPPQEIAFAEGGIVWGPNGVPICTAKGNQQKVKMVPDGSGGAIIVWEDSRNSGSSGLDIYAQRIDRYGNRVWQENGVPVANGTSYEGNPVVVADGNGGAIIAWEDRRATYPGIYALRISGTGEPSWTETGVPVSSAPMVTPSTPDIASDGDGGAVIVWQETYNNNWSIRAQRVKFDGTLPWGTTGKIVSQEPTLGLPKENPKIINYGTEYVIITWQDMRSGGHYDIYAQKMELTTGTTLWASNGNAVTQAAYGQLNPEIVSDGQGGAIITWTDYRSGTTDPDIYGQRILPNGSRFWIPADGIPVCKMEGDQRNPVIVDSRVEGVIDGAIIIWEDKRYDPYGDIYAVKVGLDESNCDLTPGAKLIATGPQVQKLPRLVSDNQGGGIGTWVENDLLTSQYKIFAQRRNQNGDPVWSMYPGVLVCQGSGISNHQIVKDDAGGIIVAWEAIGATSGYDIFAQRVAEAPLKGYVSISGRVTHSDGSPITGVDVWALQGEKIISSCITGTNGYYGITDLLPGTYLVRANWSANGIESSVSKDAFAPSYSFDFTLELDYELGTIAGNVNGVEREAKRVSGSGLYQSLSPGNGIAFVELEQRGKVIVKVPLETDGNYSIPNLLPGRFVARAYNGSIYSNSRTVNLKEGETLRVDFAFGIMPEERVFNYPNPAKDGSTTIRYYCGYTDPEAEIKIYDIAGELVRKVEDNEIDKSEAPISIYSYLWDCKNSSGKEIATGIYIYIVEVKEKGESGSKKVVKRMAVIR